MITETIKTGNRTIEIDEENNSIFYTVLIHDLTPKFYGMINAHIEKQDDIFYCILVDDKDMKEREFKTLPEGKTWINKQLTKLENYYKSFN